MINKLEIINEVYDLNDFRNQDYNTVSKVIVDRR